MKMREIFVLLVTVFSHQVSPQTNGTTTDATPSFAGHFRLREVCTGTNDGLVTSQGTPARKLQALKNRYQDCRYVDGNLELTGLDSEELYNADLSFLNSIQVVTGYVLIANIYAQNVTLKGLTVIRGNSLFHRSNATRSEQQRGYSLFVSQNYKRDSERVGMRLLGLHNLAEIYTGDVLFENNNLLCHATTDIYWNDILRNSRAQQVTVLQDAAHPYLRCQPGCHSSCEVTVPQGRDPNNGRQQTNLPQRYCWAPGSQNCQKISKVVCSELCESARCFGTGSDQCCHPQCVGGCSGPTKSDCRACRYYYNTGGCEPRCPSRMIYDNTNFKWVKNPEGKLSFGKLCVQHCPAGFLEHIGACVRHCPEGYRPRGGACVTCGGPCPKECRIRWPRNVDFLNSNNIHELDGCSIIDGHLKIIDSSIRGDPYNNIPPMNISDLQILKSVKKITEYLLIQNLDGLGITNLSFLSNLKSIFGIRVDTYGASLNVIANNELEFLGLKSLKKILAGHAIIESNTKLCYLDGLKWSKFFKGIAGQQQFIRHNAADNSLCIPNNKTCHEECRNGCWGPTAKMCINCQHYKYRDECVLDCNQPMLYSMPNKNKCLDCHPECNSTCTGPRSNQCDSCRNYKDSPFCVSNCPKRTDLGVCKHPDANGVCQPCDEN